MKLNELKFPKGARKNRKRVGRGPGSGHGQTSTRGDKGLKARSGAPGRQGYEGGQMPLMRRIPKRGFHNPHQKFYYKILNISDLAKIEQIDIIDSEILLNHGLIKKKTDKIKILGNGELNRKIKVIADAFSESAKIKIESKGGTATIRTKSN